MPYLAFLKKKLSRFKKTVPSESSNSKKEVVLYKKTNETWGSLHVDLIQKIIEKSWNKKNGSKHDNNNKNKFLASIALINKHWNAALCEIITELNLKKIWIGPLKAQLARFPRINSLKLTSVDTESLLAVTALTPLTELCLSSMDINNGSASSSIFSKFDKLRKLKFHNSPLIDDRYVRAIRKCTTLTDLDLSGCNLITDNGINSITQISGLTRLNLSECIEITSLGLQSLSTLKNLESLDLTGLRDSNVKAMAAIGSLTKLTEIVFHMSPTLSDAGVRHLAQLSSLIKLSLFGCDQISDDSLYEIAKLKNLNYLNLGWCYRITDLGISYIVDLAELKELNLSFASITYNGLTNLSTLTELRRLDLRGCAMGGTLTVYMIRQGMNFLKGFMADSHFRVLYT